jgi:hypothetical protein
MFAPKFESGYSLGTRMFVVPSPAIGTPQAMPIIVLRGPRIIATNRQAPRIYPRMIPLCSRFDSMLVTPKMSAIASYGNYSRSP